MKNLIQFFIRYSIFFLFLLLEIFALMLVVKNNKYQRSAFFSSTNMIVAGLYNTTSSITDFFYLRQVNSHLSEENTQLQNEIIKLKNIISIKESGFTTNPNYITADSDLQYISAKVVNNSTNRYKNYLTINKGLRDNVTSGMGVVSEQGVVGIVKTVSDKFAVVIPILNPEISISSKLKSNNYVGPLVWDGENYRYAYLKDIARHVPVTKGDTLITSGLTAIFPEGVPIGTITEHSLEESDSYHTIKVALSVNFKTLSYVKVIQNKNALEQILLEQEAQK